MKKFLLLIMALSFLFEPEAQTWETQLKRLNGKSKDKTLKLVPEMKLDIGHLLTDNDSLKAYNYFSGFFMGGNRDTIRIRLNEIRENSTFSNGIKKQSTIPVKYYHSIPLRDTNLMDIALTDIDYLRFQRNKTWNGGEVVEPLIYLSLLTLFLSPVISYDFKNGELNAERYKYWALGSTAGIFTAFVAIITINAIDGPDKFRFKTSWPDKYGKEWKFANRPEPR